MKATRHNGRAGKHGAYNPKHNDREFDEENSEHIDAERTIFNVYWDCYQGYSLPNAENERAKFTFTEVEKAYYVEHYSEHVDGQNERNRKARHYDRVKTIDGILTNTKTCPEETLLQLGNIDGTVKHDVDVVKDYGELLQKQPKEKLSDSSKSVASKVVNAIISRLEKASQVLLGNIITALNEPKNKTKAKEQIKEHARVSIQEKLKAMQKQIREDEQKRDVPIRKKNMEL